MLPTITEYREIFLTNSVGSDSTRYNYKKVFDLAINEFGGSFLLHKFTAGHAKQFKAFLNSRYGSVRTINEYLGLLRTIYKSFWKSYKKAIYDLDPSYFFIQDNPFEGVMYSQRQIKNTPPKGHFFLEDEEFDKLLSAIRKLRVGDPEQLYDLVMLYRYTGMRRGEPFLLTADSVKDNHIVVVSEKTKSIRLVPKFTEIAGILDRRKNSNSFFHYSLSTLNYHFRMAVKNAGIREATLHTLRKTFGSDHIINGVPIRKVADWLGHEDIKTTETWYYVLINNDHDKWIKLKSNEYQTIAN